MRVWAWVSFFFLGIIWGSSFLLIRVGVSEVSPSQVAFIRTTIAAIGLLTVALLRGKKLPRDRRTWVILTAIGIGNAAIPYFLIGLSEQVIASSVASILQSTVPLFSLVIAHFALEDERMSINKVIGLLLGFSGVVILATRTGSEPEAANSIMGMMGMVTASLFYAIFTVFTRKTVSSRLEPIVIAATTFIPASIFSFFLMHTEQYIGGRPPVDIFALNPDVTRAVLMLGVVNTFVAYLFFYFIIQQLGAFRATNVTYVVPVVGVILGWLVLNEVIDLPLILGGVMIFLGLGAINIPLKRFRGFPAVQADNA